MKVKICPMCQAENDANAMLCKECFAAIRKVDAVEKKESEPASFAKKNILSNKPITMGFAVAGFEFSRCDVEDILKEVLSSPYLIPEYQTVVEKIRLEYKADDMDINAHASWDDIENERGPHIAVYEGMVSKTIPVAAMYLRGTRGVKLIHWIKEFSADPSIFDGYVPEDARRLGRVMLAETIAHETAHLIKKHLQNLLRFSKIVSDNGQYLEFLRNMERDADITALMILKKTAYSKEYLLGALLHSLVLYINQNGVFEYDGSLTHPGDTERLRLLLSESFDELCELGVNMDELNSYCNLADINIVK